MQPVIDKGGAKAHRYYAPYQAPIGRWFQRDLQGGEVPYRLEAFGNRRPVVVADQWRPEQSSHGQPECVLDHLIRFQC